MKFQVTRFAAIATLLTSGLVYVAPSVQATPGQISPAEPSTTSASLLAQRSNLTIADLEPEIGIIQRIQQGDTMCYISFRNEAGKTQTVGALFEFCENPQSYLNRRMRLVYGVRSVNDCQSEEPCGKTRSVNVVVRMNAVDRAGRNLSTNLVVLRNRDWTVTIGNRNSWSGVNGTGNLTYRGCSADGACLNLRNGVMTCRNGICSTSWRNGEYTYNLLSPITAEASSSTSKLVILRNNRVLQEIKGLK